MKYRLKRLAYWLKVIFLPWVELRHCSKIIYYITKNVTIYPASVYHGDVEIYSERNDYQNGWNDCATAMINRYCDASEGKYPEWDETID